MGKELIIEKILGDAREKASEIVAAAEQKAKAIVDNAQKEANNYSAEEIKKAEDLVPEQKRRKLSVADLEVKKIMLKAKQDVLEKVFNGALEDIKALPKAEYLAFIKDMLSFAEDGDTVTVSELDKSIVTAAFIKETATKMGIRLTLSSEYGSFKGGIILSNSGCSKNMTLELELASLKEDKEAKIAKMIFEEK